MAEKYYWISAASAIPKHDIQLPAADQIGYRAVVPFVNCFTTDKNFSELKFTTTLKAAIAATLVDMPFLAGQVTWESNHRSRVRVSIPEAAAVPLWIKHLPHLDANVLQASSWPLHALIASEICPPLEAWNYIGACFSVQANLINGGLVLVCLINHLIADGITMVDVLRVFGTHLKRLESGEAAPPVQRIIDPATLDKSLVFGTPTKKTLTDWKDFRAVNLDDEAEANGNGLVQTRPAELGVTIWYLSPEQMQRLRSDVVSSGAQDEKLTFNSCLSAFLWRVLSHARKLNEGVETTFLLSMQVRERVRPCLPREYCGNALVYSRATATAGELSSETLANLGVRIKRSTAWWTPERIREYWGSVEACPNVSLVEQNWDRNSVDLELSSLINTPYWEIDWGNGLELRAWRMPAFPFTDGFVQVLPKFPTGGVEVALHLAKDTLQQLISDPEFRKYVEYRCGTDPNLVLPAMT